MKKTLSNIFVLTYILSTLTLRLLLQPQLQERYFLSLALGVFGLLFLWALIKSHIITPTIWGLSKLQTKK